MEAPQQTETPSPTPEQLLMLLELQLGRERRQRVEKSSRNRAIFLAAGILVIVIAAGVALIVAQGMLADLRDRGAGQPMLGRMDAGR
jgi:hypothetical protein